jgi:hypothetical protein
MIMMQKCQESDRKDQEWIFEDIKMHQSKMSEILLGG